MTYDLFSMSKSNKFFLFGTMQTKNTEYQKQNTKIGKHLEYGAGNVHNDYNHVTDIHINGREAARKKKYQQ